MLRSVGHDNRRRQSFIAESWSTATPGQVAGPMHLFGSPYRGSRSLKTSHFAHGRDDKGRLSLLMVLLSWIDSAVSQAGVYACSGGAGAGSFALLLAHGSRFWVHGLECSGSAGFSEFSMGCATERMGCIRYPKAMGARALLRSGFFADVVGVPPSTLYPGPPHFTCLWSVDPGLGQLVHRLGQGSVAGSDLRHCRSFCGVRTHSKITPMVALALGDFITHGSSAGVCAATCHRPHVQSL